jgi:hypothetical protein
MPAGNVCHNPSFSYSSFSVFFGGLKALNAFLKENEHGAKTAGNEAQARFHPTLFIHPDRAASGMRQHAA